MIGALGALREPDQRDDPADLAGQGLQRGPDRVEKVAAQEQVLGVAREAELGQEDELGAGLARTPIASEISSALPSTSPTVGLI